jgi:hypothetical protein
LEKPNQIGVKGTKLTLKPALEVEIEEKYNNPASVSVVCLIDATVEVTGTVSNTKYVFHGAGTALEVDERDVDELLNKKRGRACCGGIGGTSIFALA